MQQAGTAAAGGGLHHWEKGMHVQATCSHACMHGMMHDDARSTKYRSEIDDPCFNFCARYYSGRRAHVHVACAGRSARSDPLSAVHDAHSEPGRGVGGMRGHACHSRGTGREGDADAYGRIDMHVVCCHGLASFGRSRTDGPKGASHACPVASARGVRHDCRVGVMRRCALRNELDDELAVRLREREREAARLHARPGRRACGAVGRRAAG
jgi:hypothetical protein